MKRTPLLLLLMFSLQSLFGQVDVGDSLALVALYNNCNGTNWTEQSNWLIGPVNSWGGVVVSDGRVSELHLKENGITGILPSELNDLTLLKILYFNYNDISDISVLSGITGLERLYIDSIQTSDFSALSSLINVRKITCKYNYLTDISFVQSLDSIQTLTLSDNNLTDISALNSSPGIGSGDNILLHRNPLSANSLNNEIPLLESKGVNVYYDEPVTGGEVNTQDSLALVALYNECNGPNWTRSSNWLTGPVESWEGVAVDSNRVIELDLNNNNLKGTIQSSFNDLDTLKKLNLNDNTLSNSALNFLSSCPLEEIRLNGMLSLTDIEGVPATVRVLSLINCSIQLLDRLEWTGSLYWLDVSNNNISDILDLCNNGYFEYTGGGDIYLYGNPLSTVSEETYIPLLESWGNTVHWDGDGQSSAVSSTDSLALVALYNNCNGPNWNNKNNWLITPVSFWYGITLAGDRVKNIRLPGNNLSGAIPNELSGDFNFDTIDFSNNNITDIHGLINPFYGSDSWDILDIRNNPLSLEALHVDITQLQVNGVSVYYDEISGNITQDSLALVALYNQCNGPNWNEKGNWLTGNVNTWFGITIDYGRVTKIELESNNLTGTFPSEMQNITSLRTLYIRYNDISDISSISNLTLLSTLEIVDNNISDISFASGLTSLHTIGAKNNEISDISSLEHCHNLTIIALDSNNISSIKPLVNNPGISGNSNMIWIGSNPLSYEAYFIDIPTLEARDVYVNFQNVEIPSPTVNTEDSLSMVALYNLCNGPNWINNDNWLTGPLDTWYGITLFGGRVKNIRLPNNNLSGDLPSELNTNDFLKGHAYYDSLIFNNNSITDVYVLTHDSEYGSSQNDVLDIRNNPLSPNAIQIVIPQLIANGVTVLWGNIVSNRIYISPTGDNDNGDGSKSSPYQTLLYALDIATSNDTIVLLEGSYITEELTIPEEKDIAICSQFPLFSNDSSIVERTIISSPNTAIIIQGEAEFIGLTFANCKGSENGGAIRSDWNRGVISASHCTFENNGPAEQGGAIFLFGEGTGAIIQSCIFRNNDANYGSAVQGNGGTTVKIFNSLFEDNHATDHGTVNNWDSDVSIINSTFVNNRADSHSSGFHHSENPSNPTPTNSILRNNIFWNLGLSEITSWNDLPDVQYCNVRGGYNGEGNIDTHPSFIAEDDYHLRFYSKCVNAGTSDTTGLNIESLDLDLENRIQDGRIDMGCYEGGDSNFAAEDPIIFPDSVLRAKLCEEFNCGPEHLTQTVLGSLTSFWAMDCSPPIKDLTGIEYCTNIDELVFDGNEVSDLSPVSGLTSLKSLSFDRNPITSLLSAKNLKNLETLSIGYCNISTFDDLGSKPNLQNIYCHSTLISDLSPLHNYPTLKTLWLSGMPIQNLNEIHDFPELFWVGCRETGLTEVGTFNNCPKLKKLYLAHNNIPNIDFISTLDLTYLEVPWNNISDMSLVAGQTNLETISIHDNPISDISAISNLQKLNLIALENCLIEDLSPLENNDTLTYLRLNGNRINDLAIITTMQILDTLTISNNPLPNKTIYDHFATILGNGVKVDEVQTVSDLRFKYPNTMIGIDPGKTIEISWEDFGGTGVAHRVNLDYSIDGGSSWVPILSDVVNDSSHMWTVPDLGGTPFMLKIEDAELPLLVRDTSELVSFCSLDASFTSLKADLDFTFTNTSIGSANEFNWNFGDGGVSVAENPVHSYTAAGIFDVCLTVVDNLTGCNSSVCNEIEAGAVACNASFDTTSVADTREFTFTDNSSGLIETWHWDFGDNTTSNLASPSHTYVDDGAYEVCLTVRNDATGYISSECHTIVVTTAPDLVPPIASFAQIIDDDMLTIELINNSTGDVTNWHWTFGDGTFFDGQETSHTFDEYGNYTVCLYASNEDEGLNSSICKEIEIGNPPCVLSANFSKIANNETNTLYLTDGSSADANAWYWNFGDASTSTAQSPTHVYAAAGKYTVSLTSKNTETGCTDYISREIMVGTVECIAGFTYGVDMSRAKVSFAEQAAGSAEVFYWDFGDGNSSTELNPVHTFSGPGMYTVSLTVSDNAGLCMDISSKDIQIQEVECNAGFISFVDSITMTITLSEQVIGEYSALLWELGDGYSSSLPSFSHTFSDPGYYTIGLTTFNEANGCMDHKEEVVLISAPGVDVHASFIYTVNDESNTVTFRNKSEGDNGTFLWSFGDALTSSDVDPSHTYASGGFYPVSLTAYGDDDKQDTRSKSIRVNPTDITNCLASFYYMIDSMNLKANFFDNSVGNPTTWLWEFENAGISEEQNPVNYWTEPGYYIVHLRSTNTFTSCFSDAYELINVGDHNDGLQTKFDYIPGAPTNKKTGHPVDFIGVAIGDQGKFTWDFGDGHSNSSTLTPTNYYSDYGVYEVCLTIEDSNTEETATYCENVILSEPVIIQGVSEKIVDVSAGTTVDLGAYPNPFRDQLYINLSLHKTEQINLSIYDLSGRTTNVLINTQKQAGKYQLQWNGANLQPGIYFMTVTTKTERKVLKIVKSQ